jgi:nucleoside-diphosphate-sugar epimerase
MGNTRGKSKTVLVTGGCGFIGAHICRGLAERGAAVVCADMKPLEADPQLAWLLGPVRDRICFVGLDTTNLAGMLRAARDHHVDSIIHAAAIVDPVLILSEPLFSVKSMLDGTLNVLETARILNLKRVIYLSSIAVYTAAEYEPMDEDHPVHKSDQAPSLATYSSSKLASESVGMTYWGLYGLDFIVLRLSAVYGFGMRYPIYVKPMVENSLIGAATRFDKGGDMKRDYTYVEDVVAGTLLALDCTKSLEHRIFNLSTGLPLVKASEVAKVVRECLPDSSIEIGSGLSELEETEVKRGQLSIEKARKELGLEPGYPITEGIKDYIQVYRQFLNDSSGG